MRGGLLFLCAAAVCTAQVYRAEGIAGTGSPGYAGDGGLAVRAQLNEPSDVALDSSGRLYVADRANKRVRRIELDGTIRTVVGNEDSDAAGFTVSDIALDSAGTLYVAGGSSIRNLAADGTVSVLAGQDAGLQSVSVIEAEPAGTLLAADGVRILRITKAGSVSEVTRLSSPVTGLAVAADGTAYVAADALYILRNGSVSSLGVSVPVSSSTRLAVDRWGDVYVSGARIWEIVNGAAYILTGTDTAGYSGDGDIATTAQVNSPSGLAVDSAGNVYFADTFNHRVRLLRAPYVGSISAILPSDRAVEIWPRGLVLRWTALANARSYDLYLGTSPTSLLKVGTSSQPLAVLDALNERTTYYWQVQTRFAPLPPVFSPVFSFSTTAIINTPPPLPDLPGPSSFAIGQPTSVLLSWRGSGASSYEVYLGEDVNPVNRVGTTSETKLIVQGLNPETLYYWRVIAINNAGQTPSARWQFTTAPLSGYPYVLQTFAGTTLPTADGTNATVAVLNRPKMPVADLGGNYYFIEADKNVRRIDVEGKLSTVFASTTGSIVGLATDQSQNLYIAAPEYIFRLSRAGQRTFIAGQPGRRGYSGDNGAGLSALLDGITSIVSDRRGFVFVADTNNNRVRVIGSNNQIRTFAGNGTCGDSEASGAATGLPICAPTHLATDISGNIYVYATGAIWRITPEGAADRIAGNGMPGYSGDNGPARDAQVGIAAGLAVDQDGSNVYALDAGSMTIRRIDASGTITTWAGERDSEGRAYGFAGDGQPATRAKFAQPWGMFVDLNGGLLIGDSGNLRVRRIDLSGYINTLAGSDTIKGDPGGATTAYLYGPTDIAVDGSGTAYIADTLNQRIRRVTTNRSIDTIAGGGSDPVTTVGKNARDLRLDLSASGVVEVDNNGSPIFKSYRTTGDQLLTASPNGTVTAIIDPRLQSIGGIARGLLGEMYISDPVNHRIVRLDRDGTVNVIAGTGVGGYSGDGGQASLAQLNTPRALAVSSDGELFIAELARVRKITLDGRLVTVAFETAQGLTFDTNGYLYVSAGKSVYLVQGNGQLVRIAGRDSASGINENGLAIDSLMLDPRGMTTMPGGDLLVADAGQNRVFRLIRNIPSSLIVAGGNKQTSQNGSFKDPLQVRVVGTTGVQVPGITVRFFLTGAFGSNYIGSAGTDGGGVATFYFNAGSLTGPLTVTASVAGIGTTDFNVTVGP